MSTEVFKIASSDTDSNAISLQSGWALLSVALPSALDGATLALHGSYDGTTFAPIYMDGTAQTITFSTSTLQQINPRATIGLLNVKLVSASTETAARTIKACIGKVA